MVLEFFVEVQNVLDTVLQLASPRIKISLSTACKFFEFVFATVTYCGNSWQTIEIMIILQVFISLIALTVPLVARLKLLPSA